MPSLTEMYANQDTEPEGEAPPTSETPSGPPEAAEEGGEAPPESEEPTTEEGWQNPATEGKEVTAAARTYPPPTIIGSDGRVMGGPRPPRTAMQTYNDQMRAYYRALPPALKSQFLLSQMKLSQAEQLNLQKMQNGMAAIDANPYLTDEEKAHAKTLYATKINPLLLRQQKAKMLDAQLQHQQNVAMMQKAADLNSAAQQQSAQNLAKGIAVEPHAQPGSSYYYWNPKTGKIEELDSKRHELEMKQQEHRDIIQQKYDEAHLKEENTYRQNDEKLYLDQLRQSRQTVDAKIAKGQIEIGTQPGTFRENNGDWIQLPPGQDARSWHIQREMAEQHLPDASSAAYVERKAAERAQRRPTTGGPQILGVTPRTGNPAANPPAAAPPPSELDERVTSRLADRNTSALRGAAQQRQGRIDEARAPITRQLAFASKMYGVNSPTYQHLLRLHTIMGTYAPGEAMPADVQQQLLESKNATQYFRSHNR